MEITTAPNKALITHQPKSIDFDLERYRQRISSQNNLTLPLEEELKLLEEIAACEFGQFLLQNKGLNGYWTAYMIIHGPKQENLSPTEQWLLTKAPTVRATQQRFAIFQQQLQVRLQDNMSLASLPCGLMDDLLTLDYSKAPNVKLTGIDLDPDSLEIAAKNAQKHNQFNTEFIERNAWDLGICNEFDILTSNGLNIYERDDIRVIDFYKQIHESLKSGGIFITSFLTPPPTFPDSPWTNVNTADALKQKAIFADIIQAGWQAFRTEEQTRLQLEKAGFKVLEVIYDEQAIFPTVVARKQ